MWLSWLEHSRMRIKQKKERKTFGRYDTGLFVMLENSLNTHNFLNYFFLYPAYVNVSRMFLKSFI